MDSGRVVRIFALLVCWKIVVGVDMVQQPVHSLVCIILVIRSRTQERVLLRYFVPLLPMAKHSSENLLEDIVMGVLWLISWLNSYSLESQNFHRPARVHLNIF